MTTGIAFSRSSFLIAPGVVEAALLAQVFERFLPVGDPFDGRAGFRVLQGLRDHQGVGVVVVDNEDLETAHESSLICSSASIGVAARPDHCSQ
jgi:hypothetical protein